MNAVMRTFMMMLRQVWEDGMLVGALCAPVLAGVVFRFGVPFAELQLCRYFQSTEILLPYYLLFDLFLCILTPYMFCFAAAMVMLTEHDENLTRYMSVTPAGRCGYLLARLGIPASFALLVTFAIVPAFSLTVWEPIRLFAVGVCCTLLGATMALFLFAFSRNRVEGMALAKLSGILMLGLPIPFFIRGHEEYLFAPLPSFWTAKLAVTGYWIYLVPAVLLPVIFGLIASRRFALKLR